LASLVPLDTASITPEEHPEAEPQISVRSGIALPSHPHEQATYDRFRFVAQVQLPESQIHLLFELL
jgi:hypothetical protein